MTFKILMCDLVGLRFDAAGQPDPSEVRKHVEQKGGVFHFGEMDASVSDGKLHFYYIPDISQADEIRRLTDRGQFDAVIAAATFIPAECICQRRRAHRCWHWQYGFAIMGRRQWFGRHCPLDEHTGF
jgi:hypothetical protein